MKLTNVNIPNDICKYCALLKGYADSQYTAECCFSADNKYTPCVLTPNQCYRNGHTLTATAAYKNTAVEVPALNPFKGQWSLYHHFNIQKSYVLPTQCIYVFCVDLRTKSDYFPIHN
jgi:hypothetical protein